MAALVDSNVLVYRLDGRFPKKQKRATDPEPQCTAVPPGCAAPAGCSCLPPKLCGAPQACKSVVGKHVYCLDESP